MPRRLNSHILAITAGFSAVVILLNPHPVFGASDCLAQPNEQTAASGHWYYRSDRSNGRKCWHLVESEPTTPPAEATDVLMSPPATAQPTASSFLSSLITGFATGNPTGTQAASSNSDESSTQFDSPKDLKNGEALHAKRPRAARHDNSTLALTAKQQRQSPILPRADQGKEQPAPPLTEAERAALFKKFLLWKKEQLSQSDPHAAGLEY
jgi:hypothetical protein